MKAEVKKNPKNENLYSVKFDNMTAGEMYALKNALENHDTSLGQQLYNSLVSVFPK